MKGTVTVRLKIFGFAAMIAVAFLLAIMPDNLAQGGLESRVAEIAGTMPAGGFAVDAPTLAAWLSSSTPVTVLDVRERWEYDEYHIEGSVPLSQQELGERGALREVPADRPVVVVGRDETGPAQVAALLRLAGRDAYALRGGLASWWSDVLMPASLDPTLSEDEARSESARRSAWRAAFLGATAQAPAPQAAAPAGIVPPVPSGPPAPGPAKAKKKPARGRGC